MQIDKIINILTSNAPEESQEEWDNSGWQIFPNDFSKDIKKVLICLSLTKDVLNQAKKENCELIISHHPFLFPHAVPIDFNINIPIYSAHTNLDKADFGTTNTLIKTLSYNNIKSHEDFLRYVDLEQETDLKTIIANIKTKLNLDTIRIANNANIQKIKRIAFCAGSGTEFLQDTETINAQILVTGDVKYHTALESNDIIIDIGHFESEKPVLNTIKQMLSEIEVIIADEKSPFINY